MRRRVPALLTVLGSCLVAAGVVVLAAANAARGGPADVGWTAYTPLADEVAYRSSLVVSFDDGWTVLWTGQHLLGALLAVAGLLVLTATGGWWFGRRTAARS
jgi:heme/copper-type cytochrome/quinol oxidase subunit 1